MPLFDVKSGSPARWHPYQTGAYSGFFQDRPYRRFGLYLRDDETYRIEAHINRLDLRTFQAFTTTYYALRAAGRLTERSAA